MVAFSKMEVFLWTLFVASEVSSTGSLFALVGGGGQFFFIYSIFYFVDNQVCSPDLV